MHCTQAFHYARIFSHWKLWNSLIGQWTHLMRGMHSNNNQMNSEKYQWVLIPTQNLTLIDFVSDDNYMFDYHLSFPTTPSVLYLDFFNATQAVFYQAGKYMEKLKKIVKIP